MADSRLPDVVPAKDLATGKETGDPLAVVGFCGINCDSVASVVDSGASSWRDTNTYPMNPPAPAASAPPPIVKIWSGGSSTDLSTHADEEDDHQILCRDPNDEHRSVSQLSDSGIDSQLTSPTVIDGSYNKLQSEQVFVLDLSAAHLSVPIRLRHGTHQQICHDKQNPLKEDEPVAILIENPLHQDGDDTSSGGVVSLSAGLLTSKRQHQRNFLPLDCSADGWQPRQSSESGEIHPTETAESPHLTSSWSEDSASSATAIRRHPHQTSPHICVQRDIHHPDQQRCVDSQSVLSERSISFGSNESSHFLADHETDPGSSYPSSRKPSFGSVRSECGPEQMMDKNGGSRRGSSAVKQLLSSRHHPAMLSRSSSSRSTFLSVPCRVPNSLWLSSGSDHLDAIDPANHKQSERQQHSLQSQLGSTSSLMRASRFSLSNPYLRLGLAEAGIDESLLARMAGEEGEDFVMNMFDEAYYERSVQLSLTQRLAFPQLVEIDPEASKPAGRHQQSNQLPREESSLNFFAKIITFLVLVFVIVLVVGVLVKISHSPR